MAFEPNETYEYIRISSNNSLPEPSFTSCIDYSSQSPINYFSKINESGEFSIGFSFSGDSTDWIIRNDWNLLESGLKIDKVGQSITLTYSIYDPSLDTFITNSSNALISPNSDNFILVSVNSKSGVGYFYLNNIIIGNFQLSPYQFLKKQLINGDFFIFYNGSKINLLNFKNTIISNIFINDSFTDITMAFTIPILLGVIKIDTLYLTLPCGMRNNIDDFEYLNCVCGSSLFKSNSVDINIKNLNITDTSVLSGIKSHLSDSISGLLPVVTSINNITFPNYK